MPSNSSTPRESYELRLPAMEISQGNRRLFTFAVDGKHLPLFTTISKIRRGPEARLEGYQRPEVISHILSIRRYLESDNPILPNALVVAFDGRVRFEPSNGPDQHVSYVRNGTLIIPVTEGQFDFEKPGWIVDGQQRSAAIRDARVKTFPVCVTAFIATEAEQRSQFILVNLTKPLPKGLIHELLPGTEGVLPLLLQQRVFPAMLIERLNLDPASPFFRLIRTPTTAEGVVKDNSLLRMVEHRLSDGCLYEYRDGQGAGDADAMFELLSRYWTAVRAVFPYAWGLSPRQSRLMHGAGIIAMGFVMDAIVDRHGHEPSQEEFESDLDMLSPICSWTKGSWQFEQGPRRWNELQNIPRDVELLTDHLLTEFKRLLRGGPES